MRASTPRTQGHAEIAGAGFAGLTLAVALAERGWTVRVHEAGEELRAFGAGIFLWENGLRVLEEVGALHDVLDRSHEATWFEDRDHTGGLLGRRPLPLPGGARMVTLTRQALFEALLKRARSMDIEIRLGSRVVEAHSDGRFRTQTGAWWNADVVVGADGIRSVVRSSADLLAHHESFAVGVFRVLVPMEGVPEGLEWRDEYVNFWHHERRRRILYVPCGGGDLYLLLGAEQRDADALRRPLAGDVWSDSFPVLESVLRQVPQSARFDLYESVHVRSWSSGRLALLGDAAHAMPPTIGQGAGTAMMNALALADALHHEPDVEAALDRWEASERPLTEHTQATSIALARSIFTAEVDRGGSWEPNSLRVANHVPTGVRAVSNPD